MFDNREAALLAEMSSAQRDERRAMARRLLAAGRLCQSRMAVVDVDDRTQWCIDNWEAVAAEVGAELGISRGRASSQMNYGIELLERLPRLGAVFAAGEVDFRVIAVAVFRTALVSDDDLLARLDARLASCAPQWNALSRNRTASLVDWMVSSLDPAAVRVARSTDDDRHVEFGPARDGLVEFWGSVRATDAAALDRRLDQLATAVCREDPRTKRQRRADALAGLAAGTATLGCECGSDDCQASGSSAPAVVIHLLADSSGALLPGYGGIPEDQLTALGARATTRPLAPAAALRSEPGYRPSVALADFIRCRDLTCRFPGCDKPAEVCDIDHTIPWHAGGPTHPSNLALLCRAHHLLKTFWCGENGWQEAQAADGVIRWTSPSGRVYITEPGGALFFPQLGEPGAAIDAVGRRIDPDDRRGLMMPARRRSRSQERAARIAWERGLNEARMAADPPPF